MDWLCKHPPFPEVKDIMSINNGVIGDEKIICHMCQEIGCIGISKIIGSDFYTVKFKRNYRIKSLGVMNAGIRIEGDIAPINPLLIFQRMNIAKEPEKKLEKFFTYELAPFPLPLFNDDGMRKCVKSSVYKAFEQHSEDKFWRYNKGCQKVCGCRKAGLKCSVICTNCSGTCGNSQVPSHDSDEEEETETVFEQTYNGIENEEDPDESDNPIADDAEEISVCDVSIDTEDEEPATPGPSRTAKRRRLR
ncbi:hypothetical protein AVEN_1094-1 [Araneus ventricosus]|uniref:Uncharacterized protein n=1 Tax=Araneus ventricosus TaxID=182803 RepID=A0A4Y2CD22_ARAVE|nr:hypothetical protein AVEN_264782-1 [Araneus ventricosus]GBO01716.1 hypothetical protein AVEN_1094-1 [Araneus ventricosus]